MSWKHYTQEGRLKDRGGIIPPTGVVFSAHLGATMTAASGHRKIPLDAKDFDPYAYFDATTNYRFQPKIAGYYRFSAQIYFNTSPGEINAEFYKNGSQYNPGLADITPVAGTITILPTSALIYLNGSTDYVELWAYSSNSVSIISGYTGMEANLVAASTGFIPGSFPPGPQSGSPAVAGAVPMADGAGSYSWVREFLRLADPADLRLFAFRGTLTNPPTLGSVIGVTGIARNAVGVYTLTHDTCAAGLGIMVATVTPQGNTGAKVTANFSPNSATTSVISIFNQAGAALDGEVVTLIGVG